MNIEEAVLALQESLEGARVTGTGQLEAKCPFPHPRPKLRKSFYVSLSTGLWICHSCGRRGSLKTLYNALGLELSSDFVKWTSEALKYFELTKAQESHDVLPNRAAYLFMSYGPTSLINAGFTKKTLEEHMIGYDPDYYRFTIPIWSMDGRLRAISGRSMDGSLPKYKVYTAKDFVGLLDEEEIRGYSPRSRNYLWREDKVPKGTDLLIVCEGFKAAMWMAQMGFHSVAMMSTSPTKWQVDSVRRLEPRRILLALDNDTAGIEGVLKTSYKLAWIAPLRVFRYQNVNDGKSPDDLDECEIEEGINRAETTLRWRVRHAQVTVQTSEVLQSWRSWEPSVQAH